MTYFRVPLQCLYRQTFLNLSKISLYLELLQCEMRQEIPSDEGLGYLLLIKLSSVTVMAR